MTFGFPNSKKNSFPKHYMRKYGMWNMIQYLVGEEDNMPNFMIGNFLIRATLPGCSLDLRFIFSDQVKKLRKTLNLRRLSLNFVIFSNNPAVTYTAAQHQGRLFWITYKWLKLMRKAGRLQLIQNLEPSVAWRHQCCIWIWQLIVHWITSSVKWKFQTQN